MFRFSVLATAFLKICKSKIELKKKRIIFKCRFTRNQLLNHWLGQKIQKKKYIFTNVFHVKFKTYDMVKKNCCVSGLLFFMPYEN